MFKIKVHHDFFLYVRVKKKKETTGERQEARGKRQETRGKRQEARGKRGNQTSQLLMINKSFEVSYSLPVSSKPNAFCI